MTPDDYQIPFGTVPLSHQPVQKIVEACGLYFRSVILSDRGNIIPQHSHDHPHATFISSGRVRGWRNGEWIGDKGRGDAFEIEAGSAHVFLALEPDTMLTCVHSLDSADSIKRKGL